MRWYVADGLGSVVDEVDPSGNLTSTRGFDVYGATRSSSGTATSRHAFCGSLGHTSEDETGLVYMRARYMDPVAGRFVSEDPAGHGANWYAYACSSPTNRVDASGRADSGDDGDNYPDEDEFRDVHTFWEALGKYLELTEPFNYIHWPGRLVAEGIEAAGEKIGEWAGWIEPNNEDDPDADIAKLIAVTIVGTALIGAMVKSLGSWGGGVAMANDRVQSQMAVAT